MPGVLDVLGLVEKLVEGRAERRQNLFEKHVEPLQQRLEAIHKDYIAGFQETRQHLKAGAPPSEELIEFLRERRRDYDAQRQLTSDVSVALGNKPNPGLDAKLWSALKGYAVAVRDYLSATSEPASLSWYSDFIDIVERKTQSEQDRVWRAFAIRGNPQQELLTAVEWTLDKGLPAKFAAVSAAYGKLRALLL